MSAGQMVCHLCDAYRATLGEIAVSPASGIFQRTVMKWAALRLPMKWPPGVPTRPEIEQGAGGTPPTEFERDRAELLVSFSRFCGTGGRVSPAHPIFGQMRAEEWLRWGYLHADHHLRQFGR
jgi:hypothetical protein